jgi:hypothetical protein
VPAVLYMHAPLRASRLPRLTTQLPRLTDKHSCPAQLTTQLSRSTDKHLAVLMVASPAAVAPVCAQRGWCWRRRW